MPTSKINYKKLYEEAIFDKINLEKEINKINIVLENTKKLVDSNNINFKELYDKILIENNELKEKLKNTLRLKEVNCIMKKIKIKL